MSRNRQIKLNGEKANIKGFINGEQFRLYYRTFKDSKGRTHRIISGPNLTKIKRAG